VTLAQLITELDLPPARIAVELNREVVRRNDWDATELRDDDRIEIVHFVGGGRSLIRVKFSYVDSNEREGFG
jgi:thiamine biosynthesis protein ThiS